MSASNEIEETLIIILSEELSREESSIGVQDNFFDLGLNSLKMVTLVKKIYQEIGIKIPLVSFFQYENIQELSAFLIGEEEEELVEDENMVDDIDDFIDLMEL